MKNLENMNALNDMEMEEVTGGTFGDSIPALLNLITGLVFHPNDLVNGAVRPLPFPCVPNTRPLPFPQDRR